MAALAHLCLDLGYSVEGIDRAGNEHTERLKSAGISVTVGEEMPQELPAADLYVYTLAVPLTHPLLTLARQKGIPTVSRPAFLGAIQLLYPVRVAVAGMHGKSSTVGMCAEILKAAGKRPTVLSGADLSPKEGSYRRGDAELLLFEACEYRDAFLHFFPTHAAVLNTEWEHTDYFADVAAVNASFSAFLSSGALSLAVLPQEERDLFSPPNARILTFGEEGDYRAANLSQKEGVYSFDLLEKGVLLGRVKLQVPGRFQVKNALAAAALCRSLGIPAEKNVTGLCLYQGTARRMQKIRLTEGRALYLDYAHHPTELKAALSTAKEMGKGVACVFQPHTYSRVAAFHAAYAESLFSLEAAGVLPIYAARERDTLGMSAEKLARESRAVFLPDFKAAADFLLKNAGEGRTLLLAGAGDIEKVLSFLPLAEKESTVSEN